MYKRQDLEGGQRWLEEYHLGLEDRTQELERQVDEQMKTIIEQEYAAYIVDKAAELGLTCTCLLYTSRSNYDSPGKKAVRDDGL